MVVATVVNRTAAPSWMARMALTRWVLTAAGLAAEDEVVPLTGVVLAEVGREKIA